jgi:hypothetical protein
VCREEGRRRRWRKGKCLTRREEGLARRFDGRRRKEEEEEGEEEGGC